MSDFDKQQLSSRTAAGSVASADNTSGLTVTLETYGRPFVNAEYDVGDNAVIVLEGRYDLPDGSYTNWQEYDRADTSDADVDADSIIQAPWVSYDEVRLTTATTDIDVNFIVSAGR